MKTNLPLVPFLIVLILACSAGANPVNPDFPFAYLSQNRLCDGVAPRVLNVGTLGATRSGGCCGTDELWTPGAPVKISSLGGPSKLGFFSPDHDFKMPHFSITPDLVGDISRFVAGYDYTKFPLDKSIVAVVDPVVSLMEMMSLRHATIEMCMNRIDVINVYQNKTDGSVIRYGLGYNIYLNVDTNQGRQKLLVQQLAGEVQTQARFFHLYYDFVPQTQLLFDESMVQIPGTFGNFLTNSSSAEATNNLNTIKAELSGLMDF